MVTALESRHSLHGPVFFKFIRNQLKLPFLIVRCLRLHTKEKGTSLPELTAPESENVHPPLQRTGNN